MLKKIEVVKTYWIGITETQKKELIETILIINNSKIPVEFTIEQAEAFSELRQALLNV